MSPDTIETIKFWSQFSHPVLMWTIFGATVYALYLGIQIIRTRNADKEERKELIKKNFKDKHHLIGSALLAFLVLGNMGGMAITYVNNGKLFVGPHLIVGLTMTGLMAVAASLVPLMQKGNALARNSHIAINVTLLGLFGWQALTGMQIVQKILSNM